MNKISPTSDMRTYAFSNRSQLSSKPIFSGLIEELFDPGSLFVEPLYFLFKEVAEIYEKKPTEFQMLGPTDPGTVPRVPLEHLSDKPHILGN